MTSLDDQALKLIFLITYVCQKKCVTKIVFLYQQKRFAKLRKAAAVLMEVRDLLTILLDEVGAMNQLIEVWRMYISSELFIAELECLAFFNYHVTFHFLHCIEMSNQVDFCRILPQLS